ncbi:MAG: hypothetical protein RLZZ267_8 [Bacillota bacterium]|jgi:hypothetical protein
MHVIQLTIVFLLFFVLLFGIGFILNMLLKTTYFPLYAYLLAALPFAIYWYWDSELSVSANLTSFQAADYLIAVSGLIGAWLSGKTIQTLRNNGYRMF